MGDGFAKMSQLAESAAQAAASAKADAEAKLVASLNADDTTKAGKPAGGEGEGGGLDFTSMPRKELEEVSAQVSISSSAKSTCFLLTLN